MKNKQTRFSIKFKIFAFLITFCAFLLTLLWLFQVVFLNDIYKQIKISEIKRSMSNIAEQYIRGDVDSLADNIALSRDIFIALINKNEEIIYVADFNGSSIRITMPFVNPSSLYSKTVEEGGELFEYYSFGDFLFSRVPTIAGFLPDRDAFTDNESNITITAVTAGNNRFEPSGQRDMPQSAIITKDAYKLFPPNEEAKALRIHEDAADESQRMTNIIHTKIVKDAIGNEAMIMMMATISPIDATVSTLRSELFVITFVMITFSLVLALIISRYISRPIVSINNSAKKLSKGEYDISFESGGYKEICELSDTLNRTAVELSKVENLRRDFIANVSHDLRTPLTLIGGYAEMMHDLPGENNPENTQVIIDEAKRLTGLVLEMLDLSKLQSNAEPLNMRRYNLTNSLSKQLDELIKLTNYNMSFDYDSEIYVNADENRIRQVFYNLVSNAVNFTGEDKTVKIKQLISEKNNTVRIEIHDSGDGIDETDIPYIWDRYYRGGKEKSSAHKRGIVGSGIGLSIVKTVIDQHGGKYGAASDGTNERGSTFWFELRLDT